MEIIISNINDIPIYEQIKDQIKNKIMEGSLPPGTMLPSIRSLAKDLRCSVITTKNAYLELEKDGFIKSNSTKGFYVIDINKELIKEEQLKKIEVLLDEAIRIVKINNMPKKVIKDMLDLLYEEE